MENREVNVPLLRKGIEWAEEQAATVNAIESQWDQSTWMSSPETRSLNIAMARLRRTDLGDEVLTLAEELAPNCGTSYCLAGYIGALLDPRFVNDSSATINGEEVHVSDYAQEQLGIDSDEAELLFASHNTIKDLREIAENIAGVTL